MPLSSARLYGILDLGYVPVEEAVTTAEQLLDGGIDVLQLRAKSPPPQRVLVPLAEALAQLCTAADVPFIVNDEPALARTAGADGVHLGQDDGPAPPRGDGLITGRSTHSLDQATAAAASGVDYIGFGPLFPTPTKPGRPAIGTAEIAEVHRRVPPGFPVFCIGGVNLDTLPEVVGAGARRVVIVSALLRAADIPLYIRRAKAILPPLER